MGRLISDGDGLRSALDWKGASGLKPCYRHRNVVSKSSDLQGNGNVDILCADFRKFEMWEPGVLEHIVDMLAEASSRRASGALSETRLENLEKSLGFNGNPLGLLADKTLREHFGWNQTSFDWVHTALQNGFLTIEAHLYLKACKAHGFHAKDLAAYLQDNWMWPATFKAKGRNLHYVFAEFRAHASEKADRLKAMASEMLCLYGLLRHWAATEVGDLPALAAQKESFDAACEVVDIFLQCKRGDIDARLGASRGRAAHSRFMVAHRRAYGDDHVVPKHHWAFDIFDQMEESGILPDAFIIERLHLRVKAALEHIKKLTTLEAGTLAGVTEAMFRDASKSALDALEGTVADIEGCRVASLHCRSIPLRSWRRRIL